LMLVVSSHALLDASLLNALHYARLFPQTVKSVLQVCALKSVFLDTANQIPRQPTEEPYCVA
jgi:hypothetical protein